MRLHVSLSLSVECDRNLLLRSGDLPLLGRHELLRWRLVLHVRLRLSLELEHLVVGDSVVVVVVAAWVVESRVGRHAVGGKERFQLFGCSPRLSFGLRSEVLVVEVPLQVMVAQSLCGARVRHGRRRRLDFHLGKGVVVESRFGRDEVGGRGGGSDGRKAKRVFKVQFVGGDRRAMGEGVEVEGLRQDGLRWGGKRESRVCLRRKGHGEGVRGGDRHDERVRCGMLLASIQVVLKSSCGSRCQLDVDGCDWNLREIVW